MVYKRSLSLARVARFSRGGAWARHVAPHRGTPCDVAISDKRRGPLASNGSWEQGAFFPQRPYRHVETYAEYECTV